MSGGGRSEAAALFLLVVFRHTGAVLVDLVVTPDVLLELPGLSGAVANRGYPAAAHPFAALRSSARAGRGGGPRPRPPPPARRAGCGAGAGQADTHTSPPEWWVFG